MPMQLSRIVAVHKALADPMRIRILSLLAKGPLHGQALAGKLGVTPPTITHHTAKLRDVGIIGERRDKNTVYFYLREKEFRTSVTAVLDMVLPAAGDGGEDNVGRTADAADRRELRAQADRLRQEVVRNFFTPDGRLKHLPARLSRKLYALEHMVRGLEVGRKYSEQELNEYIKRFYDDYATIRREFIIHQFMYRENGVYELNPRDMWPTAD
jgi:hypothetical protein